MTGKQKSKNKDDGTFDMYHFFSRWDMILLAAFIIAFLVFTLAIFMVPQVV